MSSCFHCRVPILVYILFICNEYILEQYISCSSVSGQNLFFFFFLLLLFVSCKHGDLQRVRAGGMSLGKPQKLWMALDLN